MLALFNLRTSCGCITGPIAQTHHIDWKFGTTQIFNFAIESVPYFVSMGCQVFDLDQDHDVDLKDISLYFNDSCCLNSNCIRPPRLIGTPCE